MTPDAPDTEAAKDAAAELAPSGTLRAGVNLSNFLLVTGTAPSGDPVGVSPDIARAIADKLGVAVSYVTFPSPGELADAAGDDVWDIGLIAAEPARAEPIAFTGGAHAAVATAHLGLGVLVVAHHEVLRAAGR